jgi:type I restriction enzyme M protein
MRKDAGVDGEVQRIGQLTWMLFLKILDDQEKERAIRSAEHQSVLPERLRWRNWANTPDGGERIIYFVDNDLFPTLKALDPAIYGEWATVVRGVFEDVHNYMKSAWLMWNVISLINQIDFNSSDDQSRLSDIYEQILRDLKNTGEFYTPRAITEFMVEMIDPKLHEVILDPACGTGGFLTSTIDHKRAKYVHSIEDEQILQHTILGIEKKQLPYLLSTMNMLLHGIDIPTNIRHDNALARPLRDYGPRDQVDVITIDPPFGGVEEYGIENNFPASYRTRETADLFFVLILRLLKNGGRAAVVVPDGTLFGEGVKTRIKEDLLKECNLHTIIRLPNGVFSPYTAIKANILFFEKGRPTESVWYYELPPPEGRSSFTRKTPLRPDHFEPLKQWWYQREENLQAWQVPVEEIIANNFNLDIDNPANAQEELTIRDYIQNLQSIDLATVDPETRQVIKQNIDLATAVSNADQSLALGAIADITPSRMVKTEEGHHFRIIRPTDFRKESFSVELLEKVDIKEDVRRLILLVEGDILVQRIGERPATLLVSSALEGVVAGPNIYVLRLLPKYRYLTGFLWRYLNSNFWYSALNRQRSARMSIPQVNLSALKETEVPIPSQADATYLAELFDQVNELAKLTGQRASIIQSLQENLRLDELNKSISNIVRPKLDQVSSEVQDNPSDEIEMLFDDGTEPEESNNDHMEPFDPNDIQIETKSFTLDLILRRIRRSSLEDKVADGISLSPGFQRKAGIWDDRKQSRLIESIFLAIPLPVFYVAEDQDVINHWIVVDGLQRLTTLKRFVVDEELRLKGLEFWGNELDGKAWDEIPSTLQNRLEETQVVVHIIKKTTPEEVRFNVFKRINTGGIPLTSQEIRHALNQGLITQFLQQLAGSDVFITATNGGVKPDRQADRECVLRFIAFSEVSYTEYSDRDNLDTFLSRIMKSLNQKEKVAIYPEIENRFRQAMKAATEIFGKDAFRKTSLNGRSSPVSKALFEVWSVVLGQLNNSELQKLIQRRELLVDRFKRLQREDVDFVRAISYSTGNTRQVRERFSKIDAIVREVLHDQ